MDTWGVENSGDGRVQNKESIGLAKYGFGDMEDLFLKHLCGAVYYSFLVNK